MILCRYLDNHIDYNKKNSNLNNLITLCGSCHTKTNTNRNYWIKRLMSIYKKKISLGKFLEKGKDICDGDVVEIANEGKQVEGNFGIQDVFSIKLKNGETGNISFNRTSINTLIDGYGEDSINWIGKKVKIMVIKQMVSNKLTNVYYFLHPDTVLDDESGQFIIPNKTDKDNIPVVEADSEQPNDDPNKEAQIAADEDKKKVK